MKLKKTDKFLVWFMILTFFCFCLQHICSITFFVSILFFKSLIVYKFPIVIFFFQKLCYFLFIRFLYCSDTLFEYIKNKICLITNLFNNFCCYVKTFFKIFGLHNYINKSNRGCNLRHKKNFVRNINILEYTYDLISKLLE